MIMTIRASATSATSITAATAITPATATVSRKAKRRVYSAQLTATLLTMALLVPALMVLPACGTTEGFGKDVKNLGDNIEDSAAKNK